eukprot:4650165-Amphidinium_carterae.1
MSLFITSDCSCFTFKTGLPYIALLNCSFARQCWDPDDARHHMLRSVEKLHHVGETNMDINTNS